MADDESQSRAEYYRAIAGSLRRLARQTRDVAIRRELESLAEQFERVAEHAEKWREIAR